MATVVEQGAEAVVVEGFVGPQQDLAGVSGPLGASEEFLGEADRTAG